MRRFLSSFRHSPGGTGPKLWGIHHFESSGKRLRRQAEASRQPEAAVQASGHEQTGQRTHCWSHPLLGGLQKWGNTGAQIGCNLQPGQVVIVGFIPVFFVAVFNQNINWCYATTVRCGLLTVWINDPTFECYSQGYSQLGLCEYVWKSVFICLPRELLTPQQHYDWGLRALKTVLKACGSLLQQQRRTLDKEKSKSPSGCFLFLWGVFFFFLFQYRSVTRTLWGSGCRSGRDRRSYSLLPKINSVKCGSQQCYKHLADANYIWQMLQRQSTGRRPIPFHQVLKEGGALLQPITQSADLTESESDQLHSIPSDPTSLKIMLYNGIISFWDR